MTSSANQLAKTETPLDAGSVSLAETLRTEELSRRPYRPPDYEAEDRALAKVLPALAEKPATILQTLADTLEPKRDGFGLTTLRRGLAIELDGAVTIDFPAAGLVCTMKIPMLV